MNPNLKTSIFQITEKVELMLFASIIMVGILDAYTFKTLWLFIPFVIYNVRPISLIEFGIFGLLLIRKWGVYSIGIMALTDAVIEITFNFSYQIICPTAFQMNVEANFNWLFLFIAWITIPILVFLILRPKFKWKSLSTITYISWSIIFLLLGMPIINNYCPTLILVPSNWPYELLTAILTYWFMYSSFEPREKINESTIRQDIPKA